MAVKLSSLTWSNRIPKWVLFRAYVSPIPCANHVQLTPEYDHNPPNESEFEAKIQFLRNQLSPDRLVRVLDSTRDLDSSLKLFKWASTQKRFQHTAETYFQMISKLGMAGSVEEMEGFCSEMAKERCPGTDEAVVALIDLFVEHGRLTEALGVLGTMNWSGYKPSILVFNGLMGALVKGKRGFGNVLFVYKEMVKAGIVPTTDTLNYLLEALLQADRVDTALDQYRRMNKKGCVPSSKTFEILVSGLVDRNRVDESVDVLNEMLELKIEPSLSFFNTIIPIFCRLNNLEVGMRLFEMMKASKLSPDSQLSGVLIQCLCGNHRVDDAINLVEEMSNCSLTPTDDMLVNIVNSLCASGHLDEATEFLKDKHILGRRPHNALLRGYCTASNFVAAVVLFTSMLERNIADTSSWNILIRWLSENVRISKALEFLCRMIVSSYVPDCATYSALIVGNCRLNNFEDSLRLLRQVCANSWLLDSTSYAELVECLCRREMLQEATEVFSHMSNNRCSLPLPSFNMLLRGLRENGNVDGAIRLLPLAYYSGTSCSTLTYNVLMLGISKSGKANDMLVVLARMLVEGCTLDGETYGLLIAGMISHRRIKDCILFFNSMAREGSWPDSDVLANLISYLAELSQLHTVLFAIDRLLQHNQILNPTMYRILINGLWKEGYRSEASRVLDMMLEKGWIPDSTTHGLLMGSVPSRERVGLKVADNEGIDTQDKVSSILAEGLGGETDLE
ncbi:pentatricopeptide repeat-containing protein At1g63330-like [Diospyros lotus]|uniref:pentatricopeptide repeat-containing protein At1g63330-like n=1 Tax=Diospyros lotus TaxID=55363 RepID=UPI00225104D1|nr:pentatricopeptide repeat-containing protein At1g63330-like [Diospyros lotus]